MDTFHKITLFSVCLKAKPQTIKIQNPKSIEITWSDGAGKREKALPLWREFSELAQSSTFGGLIKLFKRNQTKHDVREQYCMDISYNTSVVSTFIQRRSNVVYMAEQQLTFIPDVCQFLSMSSAVCSLLGEFG